MCLLWDAGARPQVKNAHACTRTRPRREPISSLLFFTACIKKCHGWTHACPNTPKMSAHCFGSSPLCFQRLFFPCRFALFTLPVFLSHLFYPSLSSATDPFWSLMLHSRSFTCLKAGSGHRWSGPTWGQRSRSGTIYFKWSWYPGCKILPVISGSEHVRRVTRQRGQQRGWAHTTCIFSTVCVNIQPQL